jgi:hypothetical protein
MKSEHRHDLQTNELGKIAQKVGHFFELHGNRFLIGLCAVSLLSVIAIMTINSKKSRNASAWRDLADAESTQRPDDFARVWENNPDSAAAPWARLQEGERRLDEGTQLMFTDTEAGLNQLNKALAAFQLILDRGSVPSEVRERALFGKASTLEAMCDGNTGDAVKAYEALLADFPASIFAPDANSRLKRLKSGSGQEFYSWFAKYERPKPAEKLPRDDLLKKGHGGDSLEGDSENLNDVEFGGDSKLPLILPKTKSAAGEPDEKPDTDSDSKPESKPEPKSKSETEPEAKPEPKPEPKPDTAPEPGAP